MTTAILDPLVLTAAIAEDHSALQALRHFDLTVRRLLLGVVPYVTHDDFSKLFTPAAKHSGLAEVSRVLGHFCVPEELPAGPTASVFPGPADCWATWYQALRRELADTAQWRRPAIATSRGRLPLWGSGHETLVSRDDDAAPAPQYDRNLVEVESFPLLHPHLEADHDPWDLRHVHQPEGKRPYECRLPRPTQLRGLRLLELADALPLARWKTQSHRFFVPEPHWHPNKVEKASWRKGLAFDKGSFEGHSGWRDFQNFIWEWDPKESEWDVQQLDGTHLDVSHEGLLR